VKNFALIVLCIVCLLVFACDSSNDDNDNLTPDDDINDDDTTDDDVGDDDTGDNDTTDDDTNDDDTTDDDTDDDDTIDDDTIDDDTSDDDTGDDDFTPPTPVFGYYQEAGNLPWLESQLPVFAENDLTLFLGMDDVDIGNPDLLAFLQAAETAGVDVRAWVLLPYAIGYWPGETNAEAFAESALAFATWFIEEELDIEWIVVDMETDINTMQQLSDLIFSGQYVQAGLLLLSHYTPLRFQQATNTYRQLIDDLHELGFYAMVVTAPMVLDDMDDEDNFIQDVMDIPVSTVSWDEVSTMVYTTTFEQYLGLEFGAHVVYDYGLSTVEHFGDLASIALGLAHEWAGPEDMAAEVAAAKAAGIERIQVYNYNGAAAQPDPEQYHDAFYVPAERPLPAASTYLMRGALRLADEIF